MPVGSWSPKDERQYQHVKASEKGPRAAEIAARTVNKERRAQGRTKLPPLPGFKPKT